MNHLSTNLKRIALLAGILAISLVQASAQPDGRVSGTVTDRRQNPVTGATVVVEGTTVGTVADMQGAFSITLPRASDALRISFVGYAPQTIRVTGGAAIRVVLEEDLLKLDEVVVVGYGAMKRSHLTGAVASVRADRLVDRPVADIGQALAGQIAGVDVGSVVRPGATPTIRIRGNRSIQGNNAPLIVVDGIPRESYEDIPVGEVQQVEVLKDAISTAIYGSRAANGVILITTKSGAAAPGKRLEVGLSAYCGVNYTRLPDMMPGPEYIQYRRDRARWNHYDWTQWADGPQLTDAEVFTASEIPSVQSGRFVDWNALLYQKSALTQQYDLYIDNAKEDSRIRFSSTWRRDEGYYKNNDYSRLTLGLSADQQLLPFLDFNVNVRYANPIRSDVDPGIMWVSSTQTADIFRYINPLVQAYTPDGELIEEVLTPYANPLLDQVHRITDKTTDHLLLSVMSLRVKLPGGLDFTSRFGHDFRYRQTDIFYPAQSAKRYMVRQSLGAYGERGSSNMQRLTFDNILNYSRTFARHALDATIASSIESQTAKGLRMEGNMLPDDVLRYWNMNQFTIGKEIGSSYSKRTRASFIGRFQYAWRDRYMANFSLRYDGSSVLSPGYQWGLFPAGSLAWVISREEFFPTDVVSHLKLRASYGSVASDGDINPYQSFGNIYAVRTNFGEEMATGYTLGDINSSVRSIPNKRLTWETTTTLNIGLDWALLAGRMSGYVEYYRATTRDLIFRASLPNHTGFTSTWENVGSTFNRGVELSLSSVNLDTPSWRWNTDLNFATNKGWVRSLKKGEDQPSNTLFIGKPWRMYYDNILLGIWQVDDPDRDRYQPGVGVEPGQLKFKDISGPDGVPDGVINNDYDRVVRGVTDPKWTMFLRNTLSYRDLSLSVGLMGKFGHMITLSGRGWSTISPLATLGDYWTPDRPQGQYSLLTIAGNDLPPVSRYRDGDYIRMQELSLSYRFKTRIAKELRMGIVTSNPFYLWKKAGDCDDPSAPNSAWKTWKSVVFKLDVKF